MIQEAPRSEQLRSICSGLEVRSSIPGLKAKPWIEYFTDRVIDHFFLTPGGRVSGSDVRPITNPQFIFTDQFSGIVDGSLEDMMGYIQENAEQERLRLEMYRRYSPNYRGGGSFGGGLDELMFETSVKFEVEDTLGLKINALDDFYKVVHDRQAIVNKSMGRALAFRVQECLLVPFIVSSIIDGADYQPGRIVDFLRNPTTELRSIFLERRDSLNNAYEEENKPRLAKLKRDVEDGFIPQDSYRAVFFDEDNLGDLNAGRVATGKVENDSAFGVFLNGIYTGRIRQELQRYIVYRPRLRVLPNDWRGADLGGQTVFFER